MADDANAVTEDKEISPNLFDDEPDESAADSATAKDKEPGTDKATDDGQAEDDKSEAKTTEADDSEAADNGEADNGQAAEEDQADDEGDKTYAKAEERKSQLNTEIRDLVAKRNAMRDEVKAANSEAYQPATEEDLIEQGLSPTDAKLEALVQQQKIRDYNEQVADVQLTLESESQRVLDDFPIFNPDAKEYNQEVADAAAELLQAGLVTDQNTGQIIGSNVSPYKLYQTIAMASRASEANGQAKAQKATERMMANADAPASGAPTKKADDPLKGFFSDL